MKVQDRTLIGSAASGAAEAQRIERDGLSSSGVSRGASEDKVSLSDLADRISETLDAAASKRQQRVEALAAQYGAGRLKFDSATVGRAMIEDALSSQAA